MIRRVYRKEQKCARSRAHKILNDVNEALKGGYRFYWRLVGSGAWGTMIKDSNGEYDLDYQILLSNKSFAYDQNSKSFSSPTTIKNDFVRAFTMQKTDHETVENSTTAITLTNNEFQPFHIDFVIINPMSNPNQIIRRNNKKESISVNEFTWNELPNRHEAYDYFSSLAPDEKEKLVNQHIIPAKVNEKKKNERDPTKLSSSDVFVREVMNYKTNRNS